MQTIRTDVAVIGAGTAGISARREAARAGARTVLIESGPYGTTCARVGCMPSKLLIAAARNAHRIRQAARFGLRATLEVDERAVLARVRRERDRFVGSVLEALDKLPPEERLTGRARFVGPTELVVAAPDGAETRVVARAVVIATGTSPWVPGTFAQLGDRLLTTDSVFELEQLPESVAVLGAGPIGLELGQALVRLGVRVRVFDVAPTLGALADARVRRAAHAALEDEMPIHLDTRAEPRPESDGVRLAWDGPAGHGEETFERVLAATGRRPQLADLDLPAAGLPGPESGPPPVDPETLQVGDAPIFLAGDVSGLRPVLHEAADEGRRAGRNAARFPDLERRPRLTPLVIVFTEPQLAAVGAHPDGDGEADGWAVGEASYENQGRARVEAENEGLVRVYARRADGVLAGAQMCGPAVEHTAHLLAWAVQQRVGVGDLLRMPVYHPVVEEGIRTALRRLCTALGEMAPERAEDLECGPGA